MFQFSLRYLATLVLAVALLIAGLRLMLSSEVGALMVIAACALFGALAGLLGRSSRDGWAFVVAAAGLVLIILLAFAAYAHYRN